VRRAVLPALLVLTLPLSNSGETPRPVLTAGTALHFVPVPLSTARPDMRRIGALEFLGGWRMDSADPAFGGWSGMAATARGLLLVNDIGGTLAIRLANGRPVAAAVGDLPAGPGRRATKRTRDAESLTRDPADGRLWIGFERHHGIWRYAPDLSAAEAHRFPVAMRDWPSNGGAEALLRLADGRFLAIAEGRRGGPAIRHGLIFAGDPTRPDMPAPKPFRLRPAPGHRITDAAQLPDGRLILLERKIGLGFRARLVVAELGGLRPGRMLPTHELARFAPPVLSDNYEALAMTAEDGQPVIWIAADDNFMPFQRSLLLKFRLRDPSPPGR
jgi:hypothetical protein